MTAAGQAWTLTSDEFRALWEAQDGSDYPAQFLRSGPPDPAPDDPARVGGVRAELSPLQRSALAVLTRPGGFIGVTGIDAGRDFSDPTHHLRVIAAWEIGGEHAYIARQRVSADISHGADVTVTRHLVASVTRDIVGLLPPSSGAGRLPIDNTVDFVHLPILAEKTIAVVVAPAATTAATAFTHPQPGTCGTLDIQIGSITDGRRPTSIEARYRDIPDDGRYLLIVDTPGMAMPVDTVTLAKMLNRLVNLTRKRHAQPPAA